MELEGVGVGRCGVKLEGIGVGVGWSWRGLV